MFKDTINYTDYNGNPRSMTCYFNLTKAEIMKMEMSVQGGFGAYLERIIAAQDQPELMKNFDELIRKSYGVKTPDGGFEKKPELYEAFVSTEAYSEIFMKLISDSDYAARFINNIFPAGTAEKVAEAQKAGLIPSIN